MASSEITNLRMDLCFKLYYEAIYEPICEETESHLAFIKLYNAGEKYVIHKHEGYLQVTNHSRPPWSRDLADQWRVSRARSCTGS